MLGDSAYGRGDARAALAQAGHQALIKPLPLRPAAPGGARRLHPRRLHRRRAGRRRDLPGRDDLTHQQVLGGGLRGGLPRLPAAGLVHDRRKGQDRAAAPARPVCVAHADRPTLRGFKPPTGSTGRWSSDRFRGLPAATANSDTAAWPTTCGCTTGSRRSTCASSAPSASRDERVWVLA